MKGDFTRQTFDPAKHYSSVRMQQGRVQIDADWNEQADIARHRAETEALDLIGGCGGPLGNAAFGVATTGAGLGAGDFLLSPGRYYVDGILCQNEAPLAYTAQPHLPGVTPLDLRRAGLHLVYLDVWERHLTALDDPHIREVALGGPDHGTRSQTLWQVKVLPLGAETNAECGSPLEAFDRVIAPPDGTLTARAESEDPNAEPCLVPASAGYRGLENQLYRVEVHDSTPAPAEARRRELPRREADRVTVRPVAITAVPANNQIKVSGGTWQVGQMVEVLVPQTGASPPRRTLTTITKVGEGGLLTLATGGVRLALSERARLSAVAATYKWSRDNGSVVTMIERIRGNEVTVHDLGRDDVLGFQPDQWVELTDDTLELNGSAGQLLQIERIDPTHRVVTLKAAPTRLAATTTGVDPARHPKLRRWDGAGTIQPEDEFVELEDGVQIRFSNGRYRTGDYWLIPARTANADERSGTIEWPATGEGAPLAVRPHGITHHYCRLALLRADDGALTLVEDCRNLFPPVTELTGMFYLGGDGQTAMPGNLLPEPLRVGVARGQHPVRGARVRFTVQAGGGVLRVPGEVEGQTTAVLTTGDNGVAECFWELGTDTSEENAKQRVEAVLLRGRSEADTRHLPIHFSASFSQAGADDPGVHITGVFVADETPLRLGGAVIADALAGGIRIACDRPVDPATIGHPNCLVTLELPFPLADDDRELWGVLFGFQPIVLAAQPRARESDILWRPTPETARWLQARLFTILRRREYGEPILARLIVKGNFLFAGEGGRRGTGDHLDGQGFAERGANGEIDLRYPSGDGKRGGDFELWFFLVPGGEEPTAPSLLKVGAVRIQTVRGEEAPQTLAELASGSAEMGVPSNAGPNAIEVEFVGPPVDVRTVINAATFIVRAEALTNVPPPVPGTIVPVPGRNAVRWVTQRQAALPRARYTVTLVGAGNQVIRTEAPTGALGSALDGEPVALPSGDNREGGNFGFRLNVD